MMPKIELLLFITGGSRPSMKALETLTQAFESRYKDCADLQVIDVTRQPDLAETHKILATPTLMKVNPAPVRRVIGDIGTVEALVDELGLPQTTFKKKETP
jgi:circadian clock protein KaiB